MTKVFWVKGHYACELMFAIVILLTAALCYRRRYFTLHSVTTALLEVGAVCHVGVGRYQSDFRRQHNTLTEGRYFCCGGQNPEHITLSFTGLSIMHASHHDPELTVLQWKPYDDSGAELKLTTTTHNTFARNTTAPCNAQLSLSCKAIQRDLVNAGKDLPEHRGHRFRSHDLQR